ncbi:MAG: hypothetical protein J7M25_03330 [Deltaproteobacteria bacterium]|nr:hypothetical protein [Deltaproteobacteria bacterium]
MANRVHWIKRLMAAGLSAGTSLVIAACYGVSQGMNITRLVRGRVTHNQQAVRGLEVCAKAPSEGSACATTDDNGDYSIDTYETMATDANDQGFDLVVTDTDGPANGGEFQKATTHVAPGSVPADVDVDVRLVSDATNQ